MSQQLFMKREREERAAIFCLTVPRMKIRSVRSVFLRLFVGFGMWVTCYSRKGSWNLLEQELVSVCMQCVHVALL